MSTTQNNFVVYRVLEEDLEDFQNELLSMGTFGQSTMKQGCTAVDIVVMKGITRVGEFRGFYFTIQGRTVLTFQNYAIRTQQSEEMSVVYKTALTWYINHLLGNNYYLLLVSFDKKENYPPELESIAKSVGMVKARTSNNNPVIDYSLHNHFFQG